MVLQSFRENFPNDNIDDGRDTDHHVHGHDDYDVSATVLVMMMMFINRHLQHQDVYA